MDNVSIDVQKFESFTKGFYEAVGNSITSKEKELLVESSIIITLECGMRFLTDYLNGNTYFKIDDEEQNLRRARVAFKEVFLLEKNMEILKEYIK